MIPPIFPIASSSTAVTALIGSPPNMRMYSFGEALQTTTKPYVVWQTVGGGPENYLGDLPNADSYTVQVDVYGDTSVSVVNVARALRDALEPVSYITAWGNTARDLETRYYRYSFTVDFLVDR